MNARLLLLAAALLAAPWQTLSAPFTYQGVLSESGRPAESNYDLRFRVFGVETGGVPVAESAYVNNVTMRGGHFVTLLDFGDGVFNGEDRWLEIGVRRAGGTGEYTTLAPRQLITPPPYAIPLTQSAIGPSLAPAALSSLATSPIPSPLRVQGEGNLAAEIRITSSEVLFSADDPISSDRHGAGLILQAGNGIGPDKNGGNLVLVPGAATGTGRSGRVVIDGAVKVTGPLAATTLIADGSGIVNLSASNLTGVLGNQQFAGSYANALELSNPANRYFGSFTGDGSALSNLTASAFTGVVSGVSLAGTYSNALEFNNPANRLNGAFEGTFNGSFAGDGSALSNITALAFTGVVPASGLGGTYSNALEFNNPSNRLNGAFDGTFSGTFAGDGGALSNVTAAALQGILPSAGLSGTYSHALNLAHPSNSITGTFWGDGSALRNLQALQLTGSLSSEHLGGAYDNTVRFTSPSNQFNGAFVGNGAGVSDVNASKLDGFTRDDFAQRHSSNFFSAAQTFAGPITFRNVVSAEGNVKVSGALSASTLSGDGAGIRNVAMSNLVGMVRSGQLQGTYPNAVQFISVANQFNGTFTGAFTGNGAGLASLNASALTGRVPNSGLGGTYANALSLLNPSNSLVGSFRGNGAGVTNLAASNLVGVLASARLQGVYSNTVQFSNSANHFTGTFKGNAAALTDLNAAALTGLLPDTALRGSYGNALDLSNPANTFFGTFGGDGSSLANIAFTSLEGVLGSAQLRGAYANAVQLNNVSNEFTGDGSALNNLNASALASGTVADARLSANVARLNSSPTFSGSVTAQGDLLASRVSAASVGINTTNPVGRVLLVNGPSGITGPNALEFGADVAGKHVHAGKIGYQTFTPGALDIVGAGTNLSSRKIKFWAEGGATFNAAGTNPVLTLINGVDEPTGLSLVAPYRTWSIGQNKPPGAPNVVDAFYIRDETENATRLLISDTGRVGLGTNNPAHPLHLASGAHCTAAGVWSSVSDQDAKEDFKAINGRDVLAKVEKLPIAEWKYKVEPAGTRHIGPTAQDFHAAFGLGESDKAIGMVDAAGVALVAIQALTEEMKVKEQEMGYLRKKNLELEKRLEALEAAIKTQK